MSLTVPADGDRTVRLKLLTGTLHTGSLTVPADGDRTVRLKLLRGPFSLGHLLYRQKVIEL